MSPVDPRMGSLALGVQDPQTAVLAQLRGELADVKQRLAALERAATVQVGSGPPTQPSRDGTLYIDSTNLRLYLRVAGQWRWLGPFT